VTAATAPGGDAEDVDERLSMELRVLATKSGLKGHPSGTQQCDGCAAYLEPTAELSYCWNPDLRILVGATWWCRWWEPAAE
jgi:hypothetical protein